MISKYFYKVLRRLFFNSRVQGVRNVNSDEPVIMVANHAGAYGPVSVITSMPFTLYPWVTHEVTDLRMVAARIQTEFCEQELHLRPPLSSYLARVIGRICVAVMKDIGAIPVYQMSKEIRNTIARTAALLEQGKNILIFAEDSTRKINDVLCEFRTGFVHVARLYYEKTRKAIQFLPVAVNRKMGRILIGTPIRFDGTRPFSVEKQRLQSELQRTVDTLYRRIESSRYHRRKRSA